MDVGIYIGLGQQQMRCWRNVIHRARLYVLGKTSLTVPKGNASDFIRNSTVMLTDFEDLLKTTNVGEARIEQLRRVENLTSQTEDFSQSEWVKTNGTATVDLLTSTSAGATFLQGYIAIAGDYVFSIELKRETGTGDIQIAADSGSYTTITLTGGWQRFSVQQNVTVGSKNHGIKIVTSGDEIYAKNAQLELVEGQVNQNPSEYVKHQWQSKYLNFDSSYVLFGEYLPPEHPFQVGTADFSFSIWIKPERRGFGLIGGFAGFGQAPGFRFHYDTVGDETIKFRLADAVLESVVDSNALTFNEWNHVVVMRQGSNMKVFTGGALDNTTITAIEDISSNSPFHLGSRSESSWTLGGKLKKLLFYNRAILDTEVNDLYNGILVSNGLVVKIDLNESQGEKVFSSLNNIIGTLKSFLLFPKYFCYENGNTVVNNVVTESQGVTIEEDNIKGILIEGQRANLLTYSEQFGNVAWIDSNITVTDNTIVALDGFLTAETLTASAANGTILQIVTSSSANRFFSVWLKRKTGTGNIDLTIDGGTSWTTKAITAEWERYDITQATVTNPTAGIRIVTDTDAIYVWGAQLESADFASSYIKTETSTVTRAVDTLTYDLIMPQSFQLELDVIPLADGDNYSDTEFRLFGTEDASGTNDEVTIQGSTSYGYTHLTGGGYFTLKKSDFTNNLSTSLIFFLKQEGSNVRARILKDGVEELNTTTAGILNHSDANKLNIGHWDGEHFSGYFKNIKLEQI